MGKDSSTPFAKLGNPAQRALANAGINTVNELSAYTEKQVLKFHGLGKSSIPILKAILQEAGLSFKA